MSPKATYGGWLVPAAPERRRWTSHHTAGTNSIITG